MLLKARTESKELRVMKQLNFRMELSENDKQYYLNLKKGYEGEIKFDTYLNYLREDDLVINDLLFEVKNKTFQIDSLIVSDTVHIVEVKNFDGDYIYEADQIFQKSKTEILNPLSQLSRSQTLLGQLFKSIGLSVPIDGKVVFINPEFTLYQAPIDKPFIFNGQINRYFKHLNTKPVLSVKKQKLIAEKLLSLHISDSPFSKVPEYSYEGLRKGIICEKCGSFLVSVIGRKCNCLNCGHQEAFEKAVMRNVGEFKLLFPGKKITTNIIHDWCNVVESKPRISRILAKNLNLVGTHQWSYYE